MAGYEATAIVLTAAMFFGMWCWIYDNYNGGE